MEEDLFCSVPAMSRILVYADYSRSFTIFIEWANKSATLFLFSIPPSAAKIHDADKRPVFEP